jgi:murein L,D-transpeptidase YafK
VLLRSRWLIISLIIVGIGILLFYFSPYEWSGSANKTQIENRVIPILKQSLVNKGFAWGSPVFMRIFKEEKVLEIWLKNMGDDRYELFKTYPICAFSGELGGKTKEGDNQAPEGFYTVGMDQLNPKSRYHLAFNVGFPNAYDKAHGYTGSFLMVHGNCVSAGCYAMTDTGIEEIYILAESALKAGQSAFNVHIFPFHLKEENLKRYETSRWFSFWKGLKQGYDVFETEKRVPSIQVENGEYSIKPF